MTSEIGIREWLFRAIAVESILDDMEVAGTAIRAGEDPRAVQRVIDLEDFSPSVRMGSMAALPAFLAFYCLENSVRELVVERLQERRGLDWWVTSVPQQIKDRVARRRDLEGQNRWHLQRGANDIQYTDFGDLRSIIVNNWTHFADLFPDQNWLQTKLAELEASRNIIAHMNLLDDTEMNRIRLYLRDWTRQVA